MSVEDPATWPQYATIDPEFQGVIDALGGPSALPSMSAASDVNGLRAMVDQMIAAQVAAGPAPDYSGVKKAELQIPVRDGSKIRAVLYQPDSGATGGPLAVIFHGGGFCIGMPEMEESVALEIVRAYGGVVVSVDYRLAPEHPFPTPIDDSFDALKWAAANAKDLGANPSKGFIIGGTSAGAIISTVLSHQARDEKLSPPLTGVWLNVPHVVDQSVLPDQWRSVHTSHTQNAHAPILDEAAVDFFMRNYAADPKDPKHSPLNWPGGHKGLPSHFIQVAGLDPLRDDGLIYNLALKEAGVPVQTIVYPGVPHGFDGLFGTIGLGQKFVKDRAGWFAQVFKN